MKKNSILLVAMGILAFVAVAIVAARVLTPEDTWLCDNGAWVKHGNPSDPAPTTGCGDDAVESEVSNFEECVAAGNPVMESYPRQCASNGETYVENIGNELAMIDQIIVNYPRPNNEVEESFLLSGEARGTWFFEAEFPVKLLDEDGNVLFSGPVMTDMDWMTESFVPFQTEIVFNRPASEKGTLILEKANPSGLEENAAQLEVPVVFK